MTSNYSDRIEVEENKYIERCRAELKEPDSAFDHKMELILRLAFSTGATLFYPLGLHDGDENRKTKIVDALGLIDERPTD